MSFALRARQTAWLAAWLALAWLALPAHAFDAAGYGKGLLWKVERKGAAPSYVFGTMHSDDERVLDLPPQVKEAFDGASVFVMEAVMDEQAVRAITRRTRFSDGRSLKDALGEALYARTLSAMASHGLPEAALQQFKPWAVATTLSMPKPRSGAFLDLVLMQGAMAQGKPVAGLETVDEQLAVLDGLSLPEQTAMLEDSLAFLPELDELFAKMHDLYLARDLEGLAAWSKEMEQKGNRELSRKIMEKLLDQRNLRMAQRAERHLKQGKAFIAVGALHLPGSKGVLKLLAKKGYRVSVAY